MCKLTNIGGGTLTVLIALFYVLTAPYDVWLIVVGAFGIGGGFLAAFTFLFWHYQETINQNEIQFFEQKENGEKNKWQIKREKLQKTLLKKRRNAKNQ